MSDISSTTVTGYTTFGTVNHSVLFGVDGGLFVTFSDDGTVIATR
jgi:hypothetical protein